MLDGEKAMTHFLNLIAAETDIARVPIMVDSSKWSVIEAGLRCATGKPVVNSLSLKEARPLSASAPSSCCVTAPPRSSWLSTKRGRPIRSRAASKSAPAPTTSWSRKSASPAEDIIFDPNVLTVATGLEEHVNYAVDFIESTRWIKANLPGARVSGGISNISFSFRGNNPVREAMHAVFLYHAIRAGLDMGIVNAACSPSMRRSSHS